MPSIRRRFSSARGIGTKSAMPRGTVRGGTSVRRMSLGRNGVKLPKVGFHTPQLGLPRVHLGPLITIHPRLQFVEFHRDIIKTNWNRINRNPLQRAANLVRIIARRSIKRRKSRTPSSPGSPPFSHMNFKGTTPPFKMIYNYPINFGTGQIIGMVGLGTNGRGDPPVPSLHEHGGRAKRFVYNPARRNATQPRNQRGQFAPFPNQRFIQKRVRYPVRPFMRPALGKATPQITKFWRNSLGSRAYVANSSRVLKRPR
jgi:hypothetical protein